VIFLGCGAQIQIDLEKKVFFPSFCIHDTFYVFKLFFYFYNVFILKTLESDVHIIKLEMWSMPNVMTALPNIGGALCSMPQSLADAHY